MGWGLAALIAIVIAFNKAGNARPGRSVWGSVGRSIDGSPKRWITGLLIAGGALWLMNSGH